MSIPVVSCGFRTYLAEGLRDSAVAISTPTRARIFNPFWMSQARMCRALVCASWVAERAAIASSTCLCSFKYAITRSTLGFDCWRVRKSRRCEPGWSRLPPRGIRGRQDHAHLEPATHLQYPHRTFVMFLLCGWQGRRVHITALWLRRPTVRVWAPVSVSDDGAVVS